MCLLGVFVVKAPGYNPIDDNFTLNIETNLFLDFFYTCWLYLIKFITGSPRNKAEKIKMIN